MVSNQPLHGRKTDGAKVKVVDLHDFHIVKTIPTGTGPNGIAAAYPLVMTPHW